MRVVIQTLKSAVLAPLLMAASLLTVGLVVTPTASAAVDRSGVVTMNYVAAGQGGDCSNINQCDIITKYIDPLVAFMSAIVGVAVVISIIVGGIEYSSSAGDPGKASAAKNRIRNALIALITYILLLGMLNFLIPGGLGGA